MKYINKIIKLSEKTNKKIEVSGVDELENIKDDMKEKMGMPIGLHTFGAPLIISMVLTVISFSLPQFSFWLFIYDLMGWEQHAVFIGIIAAAFIYVLVLFTTMMMVSRGIYLALRAYILILILALITALFFLLITMISSISGNNNYSLSFTGALLSIGLSLIALKCLNSEIFYKSCAFILHNRAWRKQLDLQRKTTAFR
ncbi:hypothetical protein NS303_12135 [Pantoea ananatis]|uniref:hypothetical protein n=1 Tax=Pantoea ananas TaxID=553 RepID=UPI0007379420|nr:hypothetical protein [Pantoea ananatis]KTR48128.1 hypothetical protein NS303_12135 [Pantoea ananatis]KTR53371.1 hypothetical protein NS311_18395 [Pantoea ananatis]KTR67105.1 hypothetical protein RSA47_01180 [Pantoea ananatis]KTR72045.1 hypothetical protein NS296_05255 [Pantoea ananatis]